MSCWSVQPALGCHSKLSPHGIPTAAGKHVRVTSAVSKDGKDTAVTAPPARQEAAASDCSQLYYAPLKFCSA